LVKLRNLSEMRTSKAPADTTMKISGAISVTKNKTVRTTDLLRRQSVSENLVVSEISINSHPQYVFGGPSTG
jgi:hypothetical protein